MTLVNYYLCFYLLGFDSHLLLKQFDLDQTEIKNMSAISSNTEKFKTISINKFTFIDSLSFLQGSLAELVDDLNKSGASFNVLNQWEVASDPEKKELLLRKGKSAFYHAFIM